MPVFGLLFGAVVLTLTFRPRARRKPGRVFDGGFMPTTDRGVFDMLVTTGVIQGTIRNLRCAYACEDSDIPMFKVHELRGSQRIVIRYIDPNKGRVRVPQAELCLQVSEPRNGVKYVRFITDGGANMRTWSEPTAVPVNAEEVREVAFEMRRLLEGLSDSLIRENR